MLEPNTGSIHPYTLRYFMLNLRCDMQHFCIETSKNDRTLVLHHQCLNPDNVCHCNRGYGALHVAAFCYNRRGRVRKEVGECAIT